MLQTKFYILLLLLPLSNTLFAQRGNGKGSTNRANNLLYGPYLASGMSFGNMKNWTPNDRLIKKTPGASTRFGYSAHYFINPTSSFGLSLEFAQNAWTQHTSKSNDPLAPAEKWRNKEQSILLPIEYTTYLSPYQQRFFFSFQLYPGLLTLKNIEHKGVGNDDSTSNTVYPMLRNFSKLTYGAGIKLGYEFDWDFKNTFRFYLSCQFQQFSSNVANNTTTNTFLLGVQYFWSI